jgi:hypothetical protein
MQARLSLKTEWCPLALLATSWAIAAWFLPHMPPLSPVHWDASGQPDRWRPALQRALVPPAVATVIYLLHTFLPSSRIGWLQFNPTVRGREMIKSAILAFFVVVTWLVCSSASTNAGAPTGRAAFSIALGLLFIVIGNYLPKAPLLDETPLARRLERAHLGRLKTLMGILWVAGGAAIALSSALPASSRVVAIVTAVALMWALPMAYTVYGLWLTRHKA